MTGELKLVLAFEAKGSGVLLDIISN